MKKGKRRRRRRGRGRGRGGGGGGGGRQKEWHDVEGWDVGDGEGVLIQGE